MRTVVCLAGAGILLVTLASHVAAQGCADFTGCWQGSFSGSFLGTLDITLEQTGDQLTGGLTANVAGVGTLTGTLFGTAACDAISFTPTVAGASFSAQVTGSCMAGTWSGPGAGTWQACRVPCCGNSVIQLDETCDDGNMVAGDGCSDTCMVEPGFSCVGQPSICIPLV